MLGQWGQWDGGQAQRERGLLALTCALLLPQKGDDLEEGVTSEGTAWPAAWQLTPRGQGAQGLHPTTLEPSLWSTSWCLA